MCKMEKWSIRKRKKEMNSGRKTCFHHFLFFSLAHLVLLPFHPSLLPSLIRHASAEQRMRRGTRSPRRHLPPAPAVAAAVEPAACCGGAGSAATALRPPALSAAPPAAPARSAAAPSPSSSHLGAWPPDRQEEQEGQRDRYGKKRRRKEIITYREQG